MSLLWNRKAVLTMGAKGGEGVRIEGLRISFEIEKTNGKPANEANILIYNLNESNKSILKTKDNLYALLEVGYGDNIDVLFSGDIVRSTTQRQGADFVTTMEVSDGAESLRKATLDKSYVAGTDEKTIIQDALQSMKDTGEIVVGSIKNIVSNISNNGFSASGLASDIVDQLTKKQGLEFSIQDNETQIIPEGQDTGEEAILLTPETGLIGSPRIGLIGEDTAKKDGVEFRSLIMTKRFKPGRAVNIQSREVDGFFKILKARFTGDTHAPTWFVTCEAVTL